MPRKLQEARLWLRPAKDGRLATWLILDRGRQHRTGCGPDDKAQAQVALEEYRLGNPRQEQRAYYVYFLTCDHHGFPIKIGVSEGYVSRFSTLQTALPYDVRLLAVIRVDDPRFERVLHKRFAAIRLRGEWFERTPELLAYIETVDSLPPETKPDVALLLPAHCGAVS